MGIGIVLLPLCTRPAMGGSLTMLKACTMAGWNLVGSCTRRSAVVYPHSVVYTTGHGVSLTMLEACTG